MELVKLNAKLRENTGKGAARRLRSSNQIPAVLYGPKTDPVTLSIDTIEFDRVLRENGPSGLFFSLAIDDGANTSRTAMLKDYQTDIFGIEYLHADFHEINLDSEVSVTVPVEAIGVCKGVKEEGGVLQLIRRELDIICKPADTPESIQIDTTDLEIGDAVHVEDLDLGDKIEIPYDVNFTILTIAHPTAEENLEGAEEATAEDVAGAEDDDASEIDSED